MDLIQPVSRLSWPVLEDLLSDSEGIFQISCQSLTYPFPFFRKVKENKKKDPFYTKTRLTRYLRNPISQNCTNKSQKWLHEIIQFLKIFKILAVVQPFFPSFFQVLKMSLKKFNFGSFLNSFPIFLSACFHFRLTKCNQSLVWKPFMLTTWCWPNLTKQISEYILLKTFVKSFSIG